MIDKNLIKDSLSRADLDVFDDIDDLKRWITQNTGKNSVLLMMSSGNFNGLDIKKLVQQLSKR